MNRALSLLHTFITLLPGLAMTMLIWGPSIASGASGQNQETQAASSCAEALSASPTTPAAPGSEEAQPEAHIAQQIEDLIRLWRDTESANGGPRARPLSQQERAENQRKFRERLDEFSIQHPEAYGRLRERMIEELSSLGSQTSQRLTPAQRERLTSSLHELQNQLDQLQRQSKELERYVIKEDSAQGAELPDPMEAFDEDGSLELNIDRGQFIWVTPLGGIQALYVDLRGPQGHTRGVRGARQLPDGSILSWSLDHTLIRWTWNTTEQKFEPTQTLGVPGNDDDPSLGHTSYVWGAGPLPDGSILSWSADHTLIRWTWNTIEQKFEPTQTLGVPGNGDPTLGHTSNVLGARQLPDGSILSWSYDHTLIRWTWNTTEQKFEPTQTLGVPNNWNDPTLGHTDWVLGARQLPDGSIFSEDISERKLLWTLLLPHELEAEIARLEEEIKVLKQKLGEAVQ